jgi:hypothetical protein
VERDRLLHFLSGSTGAAHGNRSRLARLVTLAVELLPGSSVGASSERAEQVEQLQDTLDEGPASPLTATAGSCRSPISPSRAPIGGRASRRPP